MTPPPDRQDGRLKVTGRAVYSAEHAVEGLVHAVVVGSTIARGSVRAIDATDALRTRGVLKVLTPALMPKLEAPQQQMPGGPGEGRMPLQDLRIFHDGQHVAVVIAETLELAQEAARCVRIDYAPEPHAVEFDDARQFIEPEQFFGVYPLQYRRGDVSSALTAAATIVEAEYETPMAHHHPMEPHATIAQWQGELLTLFDATQAVVGTRDAVAAALGMPAANVRVVCPFVGGGFGAKGFVWPHVLLAAVAAREVQRPVKLVLARDQMFGSNGHRGGTVQSLTLAADAAGKLLLTRQHVRTHTSTVGDFCEPAGCQAPMLYASRAVDTAHRVARLNLGTPTAMRAPGEAPGSFALECAMDELAHELGIDPVDLRIRNHADIDASENKPWSSKHLIECYRRGADRFGWERRNARPRSTPVGCKWVGHGMATAAYPANRNKASARVRVMADGSAEVACAAQDLGTGAYTVMSMTAAEVLGLPVERVVSRLGDTGLPPAPLAGGSRTTASIGPAVRAAAQAALRLLVDAAVRTAGSSLAGLDATQVRAEGGWLVGPGAALRMPLGTAAALLDGGVAQGDATTDPAGLDAEHPERLPQMKDGKPVEPFSWYSFGAHFVEVHVDAELGTVCVPRVVSVIDGGRIVNLKTATSQIRGGVIWGIGMALMEQTAVDRHTGRIVTRSLADCLVPTNPDVGDIEVEFIDRPDVHFNVLGARGIGEIGIVGMAAAIANAVYNATGQRVRKLPITPESLLG